MRRPIDAIMLAISWTLVACGGARVQSSAASTPNEQPVAAQPVAPTDAQWTTFPARGPEDSPPVAPDPPTELLELSALPPDHAAAYLRRRALGYPRLEHADLREVEILRYDSDGGVETVRLRAFVQVAEDGGPPWAFHDGTWFSVLGMGPPLDMERECERSIALAEDVVDLARQSGARLRLANEISEACPEGHAVGECLEAEVLAAQSTALEATWVMRRAQSRRACPLHDAVQPLLHRGRADLASWGLRQEGQSADAMTDLVLSRWVGLLAHHTWMHFHQGQDGNARHHGRLLRGVLNALEERQFPVNEAFRNSVALAREIERRGDRQRPRFAATSQIVERDPAALIDLLDGLAVVEPDPELEPFAMPGLEEASIIRALIEVGQPAVEALLTCAETDQRLTRSMRHVGRRTWAPVPVRGLCWMAVFTILADEWWWLEAADGEASPIEGGSEQVAAIRSARARFAGMSQSEIALVMLANDDATPQTWSRAAGWLMESTTDGTEDAPASRDPQRHVQGPRIRRLLVRRATELAEDESAPEDSCVVARAALDWEPEVGSRLRRVGLRCLASADCDCQSEFALALRDRDPATVARYASLHFFTLLDRRVREQAVLERLLGRAEVRRAIGERLLVQSGDVPGLVWLAGATEQLGWLASHGVPEARASLLTGLSSQVGVASIAIEPELPPARYGWLPTCRPPVDVSVDEPARPIRVQDLFAYSLGLALREQFSLRWDVAGRDLAIDRIRAAVEAGTSLLALDQTICR